MPIELTLNELRDLITVPAVTPVSSATPATRQIVVADRGWVFVGMVAVAPNGDAHITDASVVRVWGTTRGLGQLALEGPTNGTKLDPCGTVTVPVHAVVARLECAVGTWR